MPTGILALFTREAKSEEDEIKTFLDLFDKGQHQKALPGLITTDDHKRTGECFYCIANYEMALPYLINELKTDIVNETSFRVGVCHYHLGKYDEALPYLEDAQKAGIQDATQMLGQCYLKMKQYEKALPLLEQANDTSNLVECYFSMNKFDKVVRIYSKDKDMFRCHPNTADQMISSFEDDSSPEARYNLGLCYFWKEKYDQALKALEEAGNTNDAKIWIAKCYVILALNCKNNEQKFDMLTKANDAGNMDAKYYLGRHHMMLEDYKKALTYVNEFLDYIRKQPGLWISVSKGRQVHLNDALFQTGMCYFKLNDFKKALTLFSECHTTKASYYAGMCYYNMEKYKEALSCFCLLPPYDPELISDSKLMMAKCYYNLEEFGLALKFFEGCQAKDIAFYIMMCYFKKAEPEEGLEYFDQAADIMNSQMIEELMQYVRAAIASGDKTTDWEHLLHECHVLKTKTTKTSRKRAKLGEK